MTESQETAIANYTASQAASVALQDKLTELLLDYHAAESKQEKQKLRDKVVSEALPWVRRIATGLARRSSDPVEDLIQVGSMGLVKAIEKFNPLAGTSFKTYATYLITGEIRHYVRDKSSMIKAPRQMYELYYRMNQIVQRLTDRLGRIPTDAEIAQELEVPVAHVESAQDIERRRNPISLDTYLVSDDSGEQQYVERLVDERYNVFLQSQQDRLVLEKALNKLKAEHKDVIEMTYFQELSQTEIASRLGISQMQVSRRLRKALELLSKQLSPTVLERGI